jgi:hypothetical protein
MAVTPHRRLSILVAYCLAVSATSSCTALRGDGHADTPQGAVDATPIRYVICGQFQGRDCFVAARFPDLDGCEMYKRQSEYLCDSVSTPGKMICDTTPIPTTTTMAYCLP